MSKMVGWIVALMMVAMSGGRGEAAVSDNAEELVKPVRISMNFEDASLTTVLKTFSQQTGINVIATGDVGNQPITLYLEDVTALDALDRILAAANLTYERSPDSDIYIVKPKPKEEEAAKTITRVYQLKFARVSKSVLAKVGATFGKRTPYEARSVTSPTTEGGSTSRSSTSTSSAGGGTEEEVGIDTVLKELLTPAGKVVVDGRTNRLILTDVPDNFPRLEAALGALDIRTSQIMVDAELIETTLSKLKDLGVQWGGGTSGADLFTITPGSRSSRFPFGVFRNDIAPTSHTSFSATTLDASSFKGILKALETDTDTKILARPKVLTLDNESATIRLTADEVIGFESSSQTQTGAITSTPERTTTGVVLVVTPQVNEQGYITMAVEPSVTKTVASKVTPPAGQATPRDPKTRSARAMVRIRSGDTLVLGGLIDRSEEGTLRRVPILSGIPFLGEAFKENQVNKSTSELIVFLTPRILDEPSDQVAAAAQSSMGGREQESVGAKQESIEQTLNELEKAKSL